MNDAEFEALLVQSAERERSQFSTHEFQRQVLEQLPPPQTTVFRWLPVLAAAVALIICSQLLPGLSLLGPALESQLLLPLGGGFHAALTEVTTAFGGLGALVAHAPLWMSALLPFGLFSVWSLVSD